MIADYHIHTALCGHASGDARAYVESAIAGGIGEMGFADHMPLSSYAEESYSMRREEVEGYVSTVVELAREYASDIRILLGAEVDFFERSIEKDAELLAQYPFDYAIGSVHFVGDGVGYDGPGGRNHYAHLGVDAIYLASYDLVAKAAATGLFRIIGHLDLAKKHGHRPHDQAAVARAACAALRAIHTAGVAIELNTAGWRKPVGEAYPAPALLSQAAAMGIPLTFGSDAHRPEDVGADFDRAVTLASACGYGEFLLLSTDSMEALPG
jgi:histidinol-phosphatase (PHP family)